ncbi:EamA family transporter [Jhaorihella thermophila]
MTYPYDPAGFSQVGAIRRGGILSGNALCVASMVTWAAGFPAAEILLDSWHPAALTAARLVLAVAILLPVWIMADGPAAARHARWGAWPDGGRHGLWAGGVLSAQGAGADRSGDGGADRLGLAAGGDAAGDGAAQPQADARFRAGAGGLGDRRRGGHAGHALGRSGDGGRPMRLPRSLSLPRAA